MLKAPLRIMIVAALCVLALIGTVVREGLERSAPTAHTVDMRMRAIDPRALLSGHYVIISLEDTVFTRGDRDPCADFEAIEERQSWLALIYQGPEFRIEPPPEQPLSYAPIGARRSRDAAQSLTERDGWRGVAARGSAVCSELPDQANGGIRVASVQTQLPGIERFYAPQAEAERIDGLLRQRDGEEPAMVYAMISISESGRARLVGLKVNGEIIELNWL